LKPPHSVTNRLQNAVLSKFGSFWISAVSKAMPARTAMPDQLHRLLLYVLRRPLADDLVDLDLVLDAHMHRRMAFDADQVWMPSAAIGPGTRPTCFCRESTGINFSLDEIRACGYCHNGN
jgi:hypothetical protein